MLNHLARYYGSPYVIVVIITGAREGCMAFTVRKPEG